MTEEAVETVQPAVPVSQRLGKIVSRAGILIPFLIAFAVL